jgi:hypothetical protein
MLQEIPEHQWSEFFDCFSAAHRGWLVTVEHWFPRYGKIEATDLPLESVRLRLNRKRGTQEISVQLSGSPAVEKSLQQPARVQLEQTPTGADAALQVEAESGSALIVKFRSRLPADVNDGVP